MSFPPGRWALDGGFAITPAAVATSDGRAGSTESLEPRFVVSSPSASGAIEASAYQLHLLMAFAEGEDPSAVLERYPFDKTASRRFLIECREAGLLRPLGEHGRAEAPERVGVAPRFLGAPEFRASVPTAFTFLGLPFDGNTTGFPGARFGPSAVRAASEGTRYTLDPFTRTPAGFWDFAAGRLRLRGVSFADAGDVFVSPGEDGPELYARITDVVRDLLEVGTLPLVVGGDHSLTAAVLSAFPAEPLQIVHLDAHTDLGDVERADGTGLHHGNVFSVVLASLPHVVEIRQIGLRGWIEASAYGEEPRARAVGMEALRRDGIDAALEGLDPRRATYLSVDIDVVDPAFAPSTGTPVAGGLLPHELTECVRAVGARFRLVGMDVMEVARPQGPSDGTASLALDALLAAADATAEREMAALSSEASEATKTGG